MNFSLVHTILRRMNAYYTLKSFDEPTWVFKSEYKGDTQVLHSSLQYIIDEELAYGFKILEYVPKKGLQLDIQNLVVTKSGEKIANMNKFQVRGKSLFNKVVDKVNQLQDDMYDTMDKYESYSDEQLIRMVKANNFPNASHRMIVVKILKERGYSN